MVRPQDHSAAGRIISIKNSNDTIGNRTRDLPSCSAVLTSPLYINIILPVVLYGSESCPVTFREEFRLRVFENRVLRKIFEPKMDERVGESGEAYITRSTKIRIPHRVKITSRMR